MSKKKGPPIGFGRAPESDDEADQTPKSEKPAAPPLAQPVAIGEVEQYELLARYELRPLLPISAFELQLIQVIAGLEQRIRELA